MGCCPHVASFHREIKVGEINISVLSGTEQMEPKGLSFVLFSPSCWLGHLAAGSGACGAQK